MSLSNQIVDTFAGLDSGSPLSGFRLAEGQLFPPSSGVSLELEPEIGSGTVNYVKVSEAIVLALAKFDSHGVPIDTLVGRDLVKIHFQVNGSADFEVSSRGRSFATEEMTAGLMIHPSGMSKRESYSDKRTQASATLACDLQGIRDQLGLDKLALPEKLHEFLRTGEADFSYTNFPITLDMAVGVRELINSTYEGELRHIHAKAKSLDLLCQFFRKLDASQAGRESSVSSRDRERVAAVRDLLEQSIQSPPPLAEMARQLGTNETKLSEVFKTLMGQTIFDYHQVLRMEKARDMLQNTELSITQIAYELGYDYPANFATAFRRYFQITPRSARRY